MYLYAWVKCSCCLICFWLVALDFFQIAIGSVVSGTLTTGILDFVVIDCSLESSRSGLVQGCRDPNAWCGISLLDNLFGVGPSPTELGLSLSLKFVPQDLNSQSHHLPKSSYTIITCRCCVIPRAQTCVGSY